MKYLKLFVVFLLLQFCFVVVANDYNIYRWMPINDHFDSIAYRLDNGIFYDYARSNYSHEVKELNIIGVASENNQLKARAAFWTAWLNARTNPNNAFNLIEKAFKLNSSSLYSYDTLRMKYLKGDILRAKGQWVESYIIYKELEQELNDKAKLAHSSIREANAELERLNNPTISEPEMFPVDIDKIDEEETEEIEE